MRQLDPASPEVGAGLKLLNGAKVKLPELPTEFELFFGYHGSDTDIDPAFDEALAKADILVLESVGWDKEQAELRSRITAGDSAALEEMNGRIEIEIQVGFWHRLHQSLFGSNVRVHYPDAPKDHPLEKQYWQTTHAAVTVAKAIGAGLIDPATEQSNIIETTAANLFKVYSKRERRILEHFLPKDLESDGTIRVLGLFGTFHKNMATVLSRAANKAERTDISVSINDVPNSIALKAYDDYLAGREISRDQILQFLFSSPSDYKPSS